MSRSRAALAAAGLLVFVVAPNALGNAPKQLVQLSDVLKGAVPMIVAGDPGGTPTDTPAMHVDPNVPTSTFAGVGSMFIDAAPVGDLQGYLCSGCAIHGFTIGKKVVRDYILTAAHCLDFAGGQDSNGDPTGDGVPDVAPQNVSFILNSGGIPQLISATEIHLHPAWHGFANMLGPEGESINDDVALIRLSSPVPIGVPTYNLSTAFSGNAEAITQVGYGESGNPSGLGVAASFTTKRIGKNQADAIFSDDELSPAIEVFAADFDGPDGTTNQFDIGLPGFNPAFEGTLGNNVETTIAPGDSGSPSFLSDFSSLNLVLGADGQPVVYGVNTFSTSDGPAYGSLWGGMLVSAYSSWIDSVMVPEPASAMLLLPGIVVMTFPGRGRRRD